MLCKLTIVIKYNEYKKLLNNNNNNKTIKYIINTKQQDHTCDNKKIEEIKKKI